MAERGDRKVPAGGAAGAAAGSAVSGAASVVAGDDGQVMLEGGTYEVIRKRLDGHADELRGRLEALNVQRRQVFGAIETSLVASARVTTENNCVPRDMVAVGDRFIFGYNVYIGLRSETRLEDVFTIYEHRDHVFTDCGLDLLRDERFATDFGNLFKYYRQSTFHKFHVTGPYIYMVFKIGPALGDVKTFKWLRRDRTLTYIDNRSDHEYGFPPQHEFEWTRTHRDLHRKGRHPHIAIDNRLFIETIGGDLTIKIEDNTQTGEGIYREDVVNPDQTLDDAEIFYACVGNLILLKIRPYQEEAFRYIIYNDKIQKAVRIDAIADACVMLPGGHGLIFPRGYYLQTGEYKLFDSAVGNLTYEARIDAPNGEDYLYVFFNRQSGAYCLLSYSIIEQTVTSPLVSSGFTLFENGELLQFRAEKEPQKSHVVQIWQTPYVGADVIAEVQRDSYLNKIGNKDVVRAMAECHEVLSLVTRDDSYANLYLDLVKKTTAVLDTYFWLNRDEVGHVAAPLEAVRSAANAAIDEFEKVLRGRRQAREALAKSSATVQALIRRTKTESLERIDDFVHLLTELRTVRGELISLKEMRFVDRPAVEAMEAEVGERGESLSGACVEFLLRPDALAPYERAIEEQAARIGELAKGVEAAGLEEALGNSAAELEMLIEVVGGLSIADATESAAIIDRISTIYARLNQVKSAVRNRRKDLGSSEAVAEFGSQMKLVSQAMANYLDLCDMPEKCDEYLARIMGQMEHIENRFAEFDEFIVEIAAKRDELYEAFESRKVQLTEARSRRASALMTAAERMLRSIIHRAERLQSVNDINGYFAGDVMVQRVRDAVTQLQQLGDTVKAGDIQSQLKSVQEDAVRQFKDRSALYEDGQNVVRLGSHRFSVNRQPLALTVVQREDDLAYHLTGTGFFQPINDAELLTTRHVWGLETSSESAEIYRSEYLAWKLHGSLATVGSGEVGRWQEMEPQDLLRRVQEFMSPRFSEGYVKGVHDHDAALILKSLLELESRIGLLRFDSSARALGAFFWQLTADDAGRDLLAADISSVGVMRQVFPKRSGSAARHVAELESRLLKFASQVPVLGERRSTEAAEYLIQQLAASSSFVLSAEADRLLGGFHDYLKEAGYADRFRSAAEALATDEIRRFMLIRDWLSDYVEHGAEGAASPLAEYVDEAAVALAGEGRLPREVVSAGVVQAVEGLTGNHALIVGGRMELHYCRFMSRLRDHEATVVPAYLRCHELKKQLVHGMSQSMRLEEFRPRVLTSFVRNRLIDSVYLPLVGANMAKQMGTAGAETRTDRSGLLLIVSPPGYGKTTLMEYVADRTGLTFIKINGPTIGHRVTSLDPDEAPNASAREELQKLNLAFEMGDNIMIYVDDIQHCNAEFLQKFISLCDAQRKIEGVYQNRTRTYDLRGKRVCVVMAGNPYTESGEKFTIPDMLANRADTYNIGDIIGDNREAFVLSFLENCMTSNPILRPLAIRSQQDVYGIIRLAETGSSEGVEFEGGYSAEELREYISTMKKLLVARDVVLRMNQEYIRSAGMEEQFRTEPAFRLQGSYRNMNRIAERVLPVMNDAELWTLIVSSYENDAQTLTTGAEFNLLRFKELIGRASADELARLEEIRKTFRRNLLYKGVGDEDKVGLVIRQLGQFGDSLGEIRDVLSSGVRAATERPVATATASLPADMLERIDGLLDQLGEARRAAENGAAISAQVPRSIVSVLEEQFQTIEMWLKPVATSSDGKSEYVDKLIGRFSAMIEGYSHLIKVLETRKSRLTRQRKDDGKKVISAEETAEPPAHDSN